MRDKKLEKKLFVKKTSVENEKAHERWGENTKEIKRKSWNEHKA